MDEPLMSRQGEQLIVHFANRMSAIMMSCSEELSELLTSIPGEYADPVAKMIAKHWMAVGNACGDLASQISEHSPQKKKGL